MKLFALSVPAARMTSQQDTLNVQTFILVGYDSVRSFYFVLNNIVEGPVLNWQHKHLLVPTLTKIIHHDVNNKEISGVAYSFID